VIKFWKVKADGEVCAVLNALLVVVVVVVSLDIYCFFAHMYEYNTGYHDCL